MNDKKCKDIIREKRRLLKRHWAELRNAVDSLKRFVTTFSEHKVLNDGEMEDLKQCINEIVWLIDWRQSPPAGARGQIEKEIDAIRRNKRYMQYNGDNEGQD